jgi:hypothetical protein
MATNLNKNFILLLFGIVISLFVVIKLVPGKAATRNIIRTTEVETFNETVYRGICERHVFYSDAKKGIARPYGGNSNPISHRNGNNNSNRTSWSRSFRKAFEFATTDEYGNRCDGVIQIKNGIPTNLVFDITKIAGNDIFREQEIQIEGIVTGCIVIPVKANDNWQKIYYKITHKEC